MFDKIVAGFLTSYLGEYFENIDTEQVKISLWNGNVHLKNLRFRKDALRLLDIPFCVADGVIEDLVVTIPWSRLQSESVVMVMDGVVLSLEEKRNANYDITQCVLDAMQRRRRELEISEEAMLVQWEEEEAQKLAELLESTKDDGNNKGKKGTAKEEAEDASTNTFMARLKSCMINNVKLELKRVTLQYRGLFPRTPDASASSSSSSKKTSGGNNDGRGGTVFALHIDEIRSYSCNEKYEPCFSSIQLKMMHKVLQINGIYITLAPADATGAAASSSKETKIVYPFNVGIKLQYQPIPYDRTQPSYLLGVSLTPVQTALRTEQMRISTALVHEIMSAQEQEERRLLRPVSSRPTDDARAWWRYAIQSTVLTVRKKRQVSSASSSSSNNNSSSDGASSGTLPVARKATTFSWKRVIEMRKKRQVYIQLYKRSRRTQLKAAAWTDPLSPVDAKQLQCMEEGELPVETIKLARRIAIEEIGLERAQYKKLKDAQAQQQKTTAESEEATAAAAAAAAAPPRSKGWFSSWWSGSSSDATSSSKAKTKAEEQFENESPEVREQIKSMMNLVSAERLTETERIAVAKEFGLSAEEARELSKVSSTNSSSLTPGSPRNSSRAGSAGGTSGGTVETAQWRVYLSFASSALDFCDANHHTGFLTLRMRQLTAGIEGTAEGAIDGWLAAEELGMVSILSDEGRGGIKGKLHPIVEVENEEDNSSSVSGSGSSDALREEAFLQHVLQQNNALLFQETCQTQKYSAAFALTFQRRLPEKLQPEEAPYLCKTKLRPVKVHVDLSWLEKLVDFSLACLDPYVPQLAGQGSGKKTAAVAKASANDTDGKQVAAYNPFQAARMTTTARERQDLRDKRARLTSLLQCIELQFLIEWQLQFGGFSFYIVEVPNKQESCIVCKDMIVQNDFSKKAQRLQRTTAAADPSGPFGTREEDWMDYINISIAAFSLSCLYESLVVAQKPDWAYLLHPTALSITVKKNLLPRAQLDYAGTTFLVEATGSEGGHEAATGLRLSLSRSRLSVFCTTVSFLIDYFQSVSRRMLLQRGHANLTDDVSLANATSADGNASSTDGHALKDGDGAELFHVRVAAMDQQYMAETQEERSAMELYNAQFSPTSIHADSTEPRWVEVRKGSLVVFHLSRRTYPQQCYELIEGHFHTRASHVGSSSRHSSNNNNDDEHVLDLFIEQGGLSQVDGEGRKGFLAAKEFLYETLHYPRLADTNYYLLEQFVKQRLAAAESHEPTKHDAMDATTMQKLKDALVVLEAASHMVPCQHVQFYCKGTEELQQLEQCLKRNGAAAKVKEDQDADLSFLQFGGGVYTRTKHVLAAYEQAVPAELRQQKVMSFQLRVPELLQVELLEEEMESLPTRSADKANNSATKKLTSAFHIALNGLTVTGDQFYQSQHFTMYASQLHVVCADTKQTLVQICDSATGAATAAAKPSLFVAATLKDQPGCYSSTMDTTVKIREGVPFIVHLTTACAQVLELLYDITGILTNKALSYNNNIIRCFPWISQTEVQTWNGKESLFLQVEKQHRCQDALHFGLVQQVVRFSCGGMQLFLYYPDDTTEFCAQSSKAGQPLAQYACGASEVYFQLSTARKETRVKMASPEAMLCADGGPKHEHVQWFRLCGPLQTGQAPNGGSVVVSFDIDSPLPMVSFSDFVRNGAAFAPLEGNNSETAVGLRVTQVMEMQMDHVHVQYNQEDIMRLIEIGTRGVIARCLTVADRQPFLYPSQRGGDAPTAQALLLPPWPRPSSTMAAAEATTIIPDAVFNHCVMKKNIAITNSEVVLQASPATASSVNDDGAHHQSLCGSKIAICDVYDFTYENAAQQEEERVRSIESVLQIEFQQMTLHSKKRAMGTTAAESRMVAMLDKTRMRIITPVFQNALFDTMQRKLDTQMGEFVFHGKLTDVTLFFKYVYQNFMQKPFQSYLKVPFPDQQEPVMAASVARAKSGGGSGELAECSTYTVSMAYGCFHLQDYLQGRPSHSAPRFGSIAVVMEGLTGEFSMDSKSTYLHTTASLTSFSVWNVGAKLEGLMKSSNGAQGATDAINKIPFRLHPKECCDGSNQFILLQPRRVKDKKTTELQNALRMSYNSTLKSDEVGSPLEMQRETDLVVEMGVLDVTIVPRFWFDLKDTVFSLTVRNGIAPLLNWEPYRLASELPAAPLDPFADEERNLSSKTVDTNANVKQKASMRVSMQQLGLMLPMVSATNQLVPLLLLKFNEVAAQTTTTSDTMTDVEFSIKQFDQNGVWSVGEERGTSVAGKEEELCRPAVLRPLFLIPPPPPPPSSAADATSNVYRVDPVSNRPIGASVSTAKRDVLDELFGVPGQPDSAATLAPVLTQQQQQQPKEQAVAPSTDTMEGGKALPFWFAVSKSSEKGVQGTVAPTWLLIPAAQELLQLQQLLDEGGLSNLGSLTTFAEERADPSEAADAPNTASAAGQAVTASNPAAPAAGTGAGQDAAGQETAVSTLPNVNFVLYSPSFVMAEHGSNPTTVEELQHGLVLSTETVSLNVRKVKPQSPHGRPQTKEVEVDAKVLKTCLCTLSDRNRQLLSPFSIHLNYHEAYDFEPSSGSMCNVTRNVTCNVDAIRIHVQRYYYELLLQSFVRHLLTTTSLSKQKGLAEQAALLRARAPPVRLAFLFGCQDVFLPLSLTQDGANSSRTVEPKAGSKEAQKALPTQMGVQVELLGLDLQVMDEATTVYLSLGQLKAQHTNITSSVCDTSGSGGGGGGGGGGGSAAAAAGGVKQSLMTTQESRLTVPYLRMGVAGMRAIFDVSPFVEGVEGAARREETQVLYVQHSREGTQETIQCSLGRTVLFMDAAAVAGAISLLYTPYARIVLPEYALRDVQIVERDLILSRDLVLSSRIKMHVANTLFNTVTINGNGNHIHFKDRGEVLLSVDEGMTVRFVNAILHLHGQPLDYYVSLGNGSYIVADRPSNEYVLHEPAPKAKNKVTVETAVVTATNVVATAAVTATNALPVGHVVVATGTVVAPAEPALHRIIHAKGNVHVYLTEPQPSALGGGGSGGNSYTGTRATKQYTQCLHLQATMSGSIESGPDVAVAEASTSSKTSANRATTKTSSSDNTNNNNMRATFQLQDCSLCSEFTTSHNDVVERTELSSKSSLAAVFTTARAVEKTRTGSTAVQKQTLEVKAPEGVEVRLRYSDIALCTKAFQHAEGALRVAMGNIEVAAFTDLLTSEKKQEYVKAQVQEQINDFTSAGGSGSKGQDLPTVSYMSFELPFVSFFFINDSSTVDMPLFHLLLDHVHTPIGEQRPEVAKWHLSVHFTAEYYDLDISAWVPFLEKVEADFVYKKKMGGASIANNSIATNSSNVIRSTSEELSDQRGSIRFGIHVRPTRVHISPFLLHSVRRLLLLRDHFEKEKLLSETFASQEKDLPEKEEFFAYKLQQLASTSNLKIQFASTNMEDSGRFPKAQSLGLGQEFSFSFPRINGRELPPSQQCIFVSIGETDDINKSNKSTVSSNNNNKNNTASEQAQMLPIFNRGLQHLMLKKGALTYPIIVEVSVGEGMKKVRFRSNVTLENKLHYPIVLSNGIGQVLPHESLCIPVEHLRERVEFVPVLADGASQACGFGIRYENLPDLQGQTFLCVSALFNEPSERNRTSNDPRAQVKTLYKGNDYLIQSSPQPHCAYFLLQLRQPPQQRGWQRLSEVATSDESMLGDDCTGTFTAPFFIRNAVNIPLKVTLMTRNGVSSNSKDLNMKLLTTPWSLGRDLVKMATSTCVYYAIKSIYINPDVSYGVTEIDPLHDVFMVLEVELPNGAKVGLGPRGYAPACVFAPSSDNNKTLSTSITLEDARSGNTLIFNLVYANNEVTITCPYFIFNQTQHILFMSDRNPQKGDVPPIAGLMRPDQNGIIPSDGQPFLYNTEHAEQTNDDKCMLYTRIGYESDTGGQLQWTGWSDPIPITTLKEDGYIICSCGSNKQRYVTLSYSVELAPGALSEFTRYIVLRPRWIIINQSPRSFRFSQNVGVPSSASIASRESPTEVQVGSGSVQIVSTLQRSNNPRSSNSGSSGGGGGGGSNKNADDFGEARLQVCFNADDAAGISASQYSTSFSIEKMGDYSFNIRHQKMSKLSDYWPQSHTGTTATTTTTTAPGGNQNAAAKHSDLVYSKPDVLPPIQPEDIIEKNGELYVKRMETEVMSVSCYRRSTSVLYVVVTIAEVAPFVLENRTDYMLYVQQRGLPITMSIYPKTTKNYTWENAQASSTLMLWACDGERRRLSEQVTINFDPGLAIRSTQAQFQQEMVLTETSGKVLFVRVRGIHGSSYAVSITNEPTIDAYCNSPYPQCYYRFAMDALYALCTNLDRTDHTLLTIKPIEVSYEQGALVGQGGGSGTAATSPNTANSFKGDMQRIDIRLNTIQIDDERPTMKEKVVFQLVDTVSPTYAKMTRNLMRTTPIMVLPDVTAIIAPLELHLEDSFLYDSIEYFASMKEAWGIGALVSRQHGKAVKDSTARRNTSNSGSSRNINPLKTSFAESCPWVRDSVAVAAAGTAGDDKDFPTTHGDDSSSNLTTANPSITARSAAAATATAATNESESNKAKMLQLLKRRKKKKADVEWTHKVVFMSHFYVEKLLVSISLYRSPGAQNDPIWKSLGVFSLLIRSIRDAHFNWPAIDQTNVCECIWMLAQYYQQQYKDRMRRQLPNLLQAAGLRVVKGFVTDLLQVHLPIGGLNENSFNPQRQKARQGRRREARFAKDQQQQSSTLQQQGGGTGRTQKGMAGSVWLPAGATREQVQRIVALSQRLSFEQFLLQSSASEVRQFAFLFLRHALRATNAWPTYNLATHRGDNSPTAAERSRRSAIESPSLDMLRNFSGASQYIMRQQRLASMCSNCVEVEQLRTIYLDADPPTPLPPPREGLVTIGNVAHHLTWRELCKVCTEEEIKTNGSVWLDGQIGLPCNVIHVIKFDDYDAKSAN